MASNRSRMTGWKPYHEAVDCAAPDRPGVYEVRAVGDSEPRYIGMATNLHERLYGHPYKDSEVGNFIGTHMNSPYRPPLVRFKEMPSARSAREEERKRIQDFERKYGEKPMYNQNR